MMPPDSESLLSPLERFGRELARCRKERGLSQRRLAAHIGCSPSLIGHIETASRTPQIDLAEACDKYFKLPESDHFARLCRRINQSPYGPGWFMRWREEIEPNAQVLRIWDPLLVPGLLQTQAYARAVFLGHFSTPEADVEEQVTARVERQSILTRENPPELYVLIDEWVLKRPIGSRHTMYDQLCLMATMARYRHISVQIVPYDTTCTDGLTSSFIIAEHGDMPPTVSVDSAGEGEVSAEHRVVSLIYDRYDKLRTEAYRTGESLRLIEEAARQWSAET